MSLVGVAQLWIVRLLMNITLSKNRFISGLLAIGYIVFGSVAGGAEGGFMMFGFVILPLACIWFGDAMGGYTGLSWDIWITAPSPGLFVCIAGWILLILPILFIIL
jgi:hypothetical protein